MACRIGITTDLKERKEYWESIYPNLSNWTVLFGPTDRETAQEQETSLAEEQGCDSHGGGDNPDDKSSDRSLFFDH